MTPATLFRIASVSKMMTTLGLMRLVEQGKLSLDQDVGIYLGFSLRNPHFPQQALTLRRLLSHTSSLRDAGGYAWGPEHSLRDVFTAGGDSMWDPAAAPGSYFSVLQPELGRDRQRDGKSHGRAFRLADAAFAARPAGAARRLQPGGVHGR